MDVRVADNMLASYLILWESFCNLSPKHKHLDGLCMYWEKRWEDSFTVHKGCQRDPISNPSLYRLGMCCFGIQYKNAKNRIQRITDKSCSTKKNLINRNLTFGNGLAKYTISLETLTITSSTHGYGQWNTPVVGCRWGKGLCSETRLENRVSVIILPLTKQPPQTMFGKHSDICQCINAKQFWQRTWIVFTYVQLATRPRPG